jgi:hypothetical protein
MRDFLVDVTGVLSEWSEDAALKLELPVRLSVQHRAQSDAMQPFADLLKQMLKELQDVEIESAKAFESFANGSRVWRLASEMEDLQLLVKDDSYEGHEAALTKRFDLIEDVGGRLLGGRPDWETADAQEAIDVSRWLGSHCEANSNSINPTPSSKSWSKTSSPPSLSS